MIALYRGRYERDGERERVHLDPLDYHDTSPGYVQWIERTQEFSSTLAPEILRQALAEICRQDSFLRRPDGETPDLTPEEIFGAFCDACPPWPDDPDSGVEIAVSTGRENPP